MLVDGTVLVELVLDVLTELVVLLVELLVELIVLVVDVWQLAGPTSCSLCWQGYSVMPPVGVAL